MPSKVSNNSVKVIGSSPQNVSNKRSKLPTTITSQSRPNGMPGIPGSVNWLWLKQAQTIPQWKTVATTETVRGSQENSCPSQMSIRKNPSIVQISSGGSTRLSRSLTMNASSHEVYPGASVLRRSTAQTHPGCSVTTTSVIRKHRVRKPTNWVTRVSADLGGHIPVWEDPRYIYKETSASISKAVALLQSTIVNRRRIQVRLATCTRNHFFIPIGCPFWPLYGRGRSSTRQKDQSAYGYNSTPHRDKSREMAPYA